MGLQIGRPWRQPDQDFKWQKETADQLLEEINEIRPTAESGLNNFNALVLGIRGHGKSALINSFASIGVGRKTTVCNAAPKIDSVTTHYRTYQFLGNLDQCVLGDTTGFILSTDIKPFLDDIKLILKGHVKSGYKFDPDKSISPEDEYYEPTPGLSDKMHCVIIVSECGQSYELHASMTVNIKSIMDTIHSLNIPVMAVLTKADILSEKVKFSIDAIFRCKIIEKAVDLTAKQLAIPVSKVFPVVNFEQRDHFTWKESIPVLIALKSYLQMAQLHSHNADGVVHQ